MIVTVIQITWKKVKRMSECLYTPKEIEEELNEKAHMLNVARYIHDEFYDVWRHAEKELEVPSAEARTQMSSADLINRQDAIRALWEDIEDCFVLHDAIKSIQGVPSAVPSAQPEIIRCKDCKHRSKSGLCNMWSVFGTVTTDDDMFCSYGERGW